MQLMLMHQKIPDEQQAFFEGQLKMENLSLLAKPRKVTQEDIDNKIIPGLTLLDDNGEPNFIYTIPYGDPITVKREEPEEPGKLTEGQIKRLEYKDKVKYLDSRFTTENVTFKAASELANREGIRAEEQYFEGDDTPSRILVGKNTFIYPEDSPAVIKKKLLMAGGVKNEDAEDLTSIF